MDLVGATQVVSKCLSIRAQNFDSQSFDMIAFWRRLVVSTSCRFFHTHMRKNAKITMGDPIEHATGIEKRELLCKLAGNENPWDFKVIKRGPGTKDNPTEIPSAFDSRIVGCICHEDTCSVNFMWLHKGQPKRCECGYWFCLVHKPPI